MTHVGYYFGIPLQVEVIVCIVFGICFSIFDASLLDLNLNLQKVWSIVLDKDKFSDRTQLVIKYLLSGILLVRSFSVHISLAFYIVMLWPVIFEDKPGLLVPWLTVGIIRNIGISFLSTFTGLFICAKHGLLNPTCLDFLIAQIINHSPAIYVWFVVLNFYKELKETEQLSDKESEDVRQVREAYESELAVRRRRARSMTERQPLHMLDDGRNLISASTIENMLQQLAAQLDRKTSRSLDTMLGLMAAEAEKDDILNLYDDVCTRTTEDSLTVAERTKKLLKLTALEIQQAQMRKKAREENDLEGLSLQSIATTDFSATVAFSEFDETSTTSVLPISQLNLLQLSPHTSEKELRVINSENASVVMETLEDKASTTNKLVASTSAQLKSILKPIKIKENLVKDASCQVTDISSTQTTKAEEASKFLVVLSTKKVFPRTYLTNPAKAVKFSKESVPNNAEEKVHKKLTRAVSSFKEDGYTTAYKRQRNNRL